MFRLFTVNFEINHKNKRTTGETVKFRFEIVTLVRAARARDDRRARLIDANEMSPTCEGCEATRKLYAPSFMVLVDAV